jgi:geranylgeranyl diphosphate synthase type II
MILVSVRAGAILGGGDDSSCDCLCEYGKKIGLAFQIADDILDIEGNRELMGKDTGVDQVMKKVTYPSVLGMDHSREQGYKLIREALSAISLLDGRAEPLREMARYIIDRQV